MVAPEAFVIDDDKIGLIDNPPVGSLAPGASFTVEGKYTVSQADIDAGSITNIVTVKGFIDGTVPLVDVEGQDSVTLPLLQEEDKMELSILKSADKKEFSQVGEKIIYTYLVTNTGNLTIDGTLDPTIADYFELVDDKIGPIDSSSGPISLNAGESFTVSADYIVTQTDLDTGFITNKVTVRGTYPDFPDDPIQAQDKLTITAKKPGSEKENPLLRLKKSADKKEFSEVGEIITYSYAIVNAGNTLIRGDFYGATDDSFRLTDDKMGDIDMEGTPNELEAGESFTVTATYKVTQADLDAGKIQNIAKVKAISGNNTLEATDIVVIPAKKKEVPQLPDKPKIPDQPSIEDKLNMEDHFQYISGYPDKTVRPDGLITREEVAAVFYRLLTSSYRDSINTSAHNFKDVKAGRWAEQSIATLTNAKIIVGYEDGTFRPSNSITRAELAAIASRFDKLTPFTSSKFSDIENHWANQVINSASAKGWVNGYSDGSFRPNQYMTRAEFVALVNNVLNRGVKKENILPDAKQFPDLLESKWYYETMQEAINSHHYTRDKDTNDEIWTEIY